MATDILSLPIDQVKMAIGNSDTVILTSIPGVGKKIADRLIAELKDRIEIAQSAQAYKGGLKKQTEEAIEALLSLGYQRSEILRRLKAAPETLQNSEEVIRYFLTSHA
jgi:Holliday junction DNA helicase RuvA